MKKLLELEQKCRAEEDGRGKETAEEENKELPRKFIVKWLAEAFIDLIKLLKKSENRNPRPEMFSLMDRNVHGASSTYKQIFGEENEANHHRHNSEKSDTSARRTLGRSFRKYSRRRHCYHTR